jgi:hypothetical protein
MTYRLGSSNTLARMYQTVRHRMSGDRRLNTLVCADIGCRLKGWSSGVRWSLYVPPGLILKILRSAHTVCLCVLCGSENKQRLFHSTALTDWFLYPRRSVFTSRYVLPSQCIYVFCVNLRTNSDYFTVQLLMSVFYNRDGVCLLRGTFCPHSVFMCFVWIWEQTAIISLYCINWLVFLTETVCVYCAVGTGPLCITEVCVSI